MKKTILTFIIFNILTIKVGNVSFCDYFINFPLCIIWSQNCFSCFCVNVSIGSSAFTDLRHDAFNCLTGKIAERSKQHGTNRGTCGKVQEPSALNAEKNLRLVVTTGCWIPMHSKTGTISKYTVPTSIFP